ncbi:MAG: trypsin-like serine peptidase [Candidatus Promineifilaceae bacterium]
MSRKEKLAALYRQEGAMEGARGSEAAAGLAGEPVVRDPHASVANDGRLSGILGAEEPSFGELGPSDEEGQLEVDAGTQLAATGLAAEAVAEAPDEELLLDAWYAEYSDPATRALIRHQPSTELFLEVVIGGDDRAQVEATSNYPWRCICSLKITAADGSMWIGTGWLVGPRTVITAGHCVFIDSRGGWVRRIEVIPGRSGSEQPFNACIATEFRSVSGWTEDHKRDYDYGAILLPADCRLGDQLGWFGYASYSDSRLEDKMANLAGYPGDKPPGTQWFHARRIQQVTSTTLVYDIDTAGGQSGAPVWFYQGGSRYAVGIHTNGAVTGNSATRIVQEVFDNITAWKSEAA